MTVKTDVIATNPAEAPPISRPGTVGPVAPMLHPSIPMRFVDVIDELRTIASMATRARQVEGAAVAAACRRAESLLLVLRRQFLDDVTEVVRPASVQETRQSRPAMFTSRSSSGLDGFTSAG